MHCIYMLMISQKKKRPLSRSTSAIRAAPHTFRQKRNRPDILRQTYLSRTQSHSMGGATRMVRARPLFITQSQPVIGTRETSYHHRDVVGSQLDDTYNDLLTEAPTRKRSAVRRVNGSVPNLLDEDQCACWLVKTNHIVRIMQAKIMVVIVLVHSLLAHDMGAIIYQHCPMNTTYWKRMSDESKSDLVLEITLSRTINVSFGLDFFC
ncbi:hypothetical protein DVH24_005868 [Malus domestica]|uniref:Uncharacterized protein n=1 Tax=Malus domestica TaxID=3750 RepID=A0A498INA7_MALDO|nr:hypothetical protein DVH24_005868 [Malus domestica]